MHFLLPYLKRTISLRLKPRLPDRPETLIDKKSIEQEDFAEIRELYFVVGKMTQG